MIINFLLKLFSILLRIWAFESKIGKHLAKIFLFNVLPYSFENSKESFYLGKFNNIENSNKFSENSIFCVSNFNILNIVFLYL